MIIETRNEVCVVSLGLKWAEKRLGILWNGRGRSCLMRWKQECVVLGELFLVHNH